MIIYFIISLIFLYMNFDDIVEILKTSTDQEGAIIIVLTLILIIFWPILLVYNILCAVADRG